MKSKLYFAAGAVSFMVAGAAIGSYTTFVGLYNATDGQLTKDLGWKLGGFLNKKSDQILFGKKD
jgi:hypothetical protein